MQDAKRKIQNTLKSGEIRWQFETAPGIYFNIARDSTTSGKK